MKCCFLVTILLLQINGIAQKKKLVREYCSEVMSELSFFWKIDSLGSNGFRLYTYKRILDSKLDSITKQDLVAKLGKPSFIGKTTTDSTYIYIYFDPRKAAIGRDVSAAVFYIDFEFKNHGKFASRKGKWFFELP
jgi:hypothetical protein